MTNNSEQQKMTPRQIAIKQLAAYNDCNLEGFCDLFAANAVLTDLPSGEVVAAGIDAIRQMYQARFSVPNLTCRVHSTSDIGNFAIDRETVYGLPDGPVDVVAMYEVKNNLIQRVFFIRDS